jgi:hypothetical protein
MTDERTRTRADTGEPLVTVAGPFDHGDVMDLATGLRFVGGKAAEVPLSMAQDIVNRRQGYFIETTLTRRLRRHR